MEETKYLKYKDFQLLWFLLAGTLLLAISWPIKKRIFLESDLYHPRIKEEEAVSATSQRAKFDLNHANFREIIKISGIGPVLGRRILKDLAKNGPYEKLEDVLRVKGIGPKKLQNIQKMAQIGPPLESSP